MKCLSTLVRLRSVAIASGILLLLSASIASAGRSTYIYDESGRLRTVIFPDGTRKEYVLDASGNRNSTQVALPIGGVLALSSTSVSVNEGAGTVQLTVNRSGSTTGSVSVNYATANGSAVLGSDYTQTTGTLTWPAGNAAAKTISIPIVNDSVPELQESFSISLTNSTGGAVIGASSSATITINDNDAPIFSIANQSGTEASGTINFNVSLSPAPAQTYTVNYSTSNGTADASDFTATSGTLTFGINQTSATISVPILQDSIYENTETFTVTLSGASGGAPISTAVATGTITDDDPAPMFHIAFDGVTEGQGLSFLVSLSGTRVSNHSISYSTADETALAGSDYVATSGTLTFAPNETFKYISVATIDDAISEPIETFVVNLSSPTNGAIINVGQAQGSITDNDVNAGSFSLYAGLASVNETDGSKTVLVRRNGGTAGAVSVVCSTGGGTATPGSDYTAVNTTITWANGDFAEKNCVIPIINDSAYEPVNETFTVTLSNPTGGATLDAPSFVTLNIFSEDPPPPPGVISFYQSTGTVAEFEGSTSVYIRRTGGSFGPASVLCSTSNGTATAGADYSPVVQTITWSDGDTADKVCTVPITDDAVYEPDPETFNVSLTNVTGASLGSPATITYSIFSEDPLPSPGIIAFSGPVNVSESAGSVTYTITRSYADLTSGPVSVLCSTTAGSATEGADYSRVNQTITWNVGDTSNKTCTVPIVNDSVYEGPESFNLSITSPSGGATLGGWSSQGVVIDDDDPAPPTAPPPPAWSGWRADCTQPDLCYFTFEDTFTLDWAYAGGNVTRYEIELTTAVAIHVLDMGLSNSYTVVASTLASETPWYTGAGVAYRIRACDGSTCGVYSPPLYMTLYYPIFIPF